MILGEASRTAASAATLDDLFRRAGVSHPDTLALADPPNRADVTDGALRRLSYAQADRAISGVAAKLRGLGMHTDAVVAMQLPNTVESIVAFLGVLRAGMIAAPMPLLWRQQDIVSALSRIGAKAIITSSRIGVGRSRRNRDAGCGCLVPCPAGVRIRARFAGRNGAARRRVWRRPG